MQDSPAAHELLGAIADFLEADILPAHSGRTAFQVRIAISVCRILAREVQLEPGFLQSEATSLARIMGQPAPAPGAATAQTVRAAVQRLTDAIVNGEDQHLDRNEVMKLAMELVRHKLEVVNPEYLAQATDEVVR